MKNTRRGRALDLVALTALAVAQPAYAVIAATPEFFAERGTQAWEIWVFGALLVVVPPLALLAVEEVVAPFSAAAAWRLHQVFVALLVAYLISAAGKRLLARISPEAGVTTSVAVVMAAVVVGGFVSWMLTSRVYGRLLVAYASPAPLVVLGLFLLRSPAPLGVGLPTAPPPSHPSRIVVVVFDELPVTSLMQSPTEIDPGRFPGFTRLAKVSTWYRRATTVGDATVDAVPAILTGRRPPSGHPPPTVQSFPKNLFTLIRRGRRVRASEIQTRLCPGTVCARRAARGFGERLAAFARDVWLLDLQYAAPNPLAAELPAIRAAADPAEEFNDFLARLDAVPASKLDFLHVELPHVPWVWLPSGQRYLRRQDPAEFAGLEGARWSRDPRVVSLARARHLLQVGFADLLVSRLLDRLVALDVLDDTMLVVTADHGISFTPGALSRFVTAQNLHDIAPVPLFVKLPGQRKGAVNDGHAQTIDILPTVLRAAGVPLPSGLDGRPLPLRTDARRAFNVHRNDTDGSTSGTWPTLLLQRDAEIRRKVALFGTGGWGALYAPRGRPAPDEREIEVRVDRAGDLSRVDPRGSFVPALVTGHVDLRRGCSLRLMMQGAHVAEAVVRDGGAFAALVDPANMPRGDDRPRALTSCRR